MGIEQLQGKDWKPAFAYSIAFWLIHCDAELYDEERTTSAVFQPVPYHYIEISRQLLMFAKDSFGANFHKVRLLLIAYAEADHWADNITSFFLDVLLLEAYTFDKGRILQTLNGESSSMSLRLLLCTKAVRLPVQAQSRIAFADSRAH